MKPSVIPVLRMFNVDKAKEFYCEFLGWKIDWSHTFGENFPVYMQISNGMAIIQLSEHYGEKETTKASYNLVKAAVK